MFYLKVHDTEKGKVVAGCDRDIIGETFVEGEIVLDLEEDFYKEKEADKEDVKDVLDDCLTANLVGEKIIGMLIDEGVVDKDDVMNVEDVPSVQLFFI